MEFLKDESGQGAAEYMLLFGGVIVIAVAALLIYQQYMREANRAIAGAGANDVTRVRTHAQL